MDADRTQTLDVAVIGAGPAGLYALYKLRASDFAVRCFDTASGVGGTWFWNRYPGARCDVESLQYSFSFSPELQQEWRWTERYAAQPELLAYLEHVAERFDLNRDIQLNTRISSARFDEAANLWTLTTSSGETIRARFCVMATGCLSMPRTPDLPGQEAFEGPIYLTAQWPRDGVDFTGKRVAVIGTGSSGIQSIPEIAKDAAHVHVFQRTANFSVPAADNEMRSDYEQGWKADYEDRRRRQFSSKGGVLFDENAASAIETPEAERQAEYERRWGHGGLNFMRAFSDLSAVQAANDTAADYVRRKIRSIVENPDTAERLVPRGYPIGARRMCTDLDYYSVYNRPNVSLIDMVAEPIETLEPHAIRTSAASYQVDAIVLATGFQALIGALLAIDIRGIGGRLLRDEWVQEPKSYLGIGVAGFPNLFTINGPGSPATLANVISAGEHHVNWIARALEQMREQGLERIEPEADAQQAWFEQTQEIASRTLFFRASTSSYIYAAPDGQRTFLNYAGGFDAYIQASNDVADQGYRGFLLR
jgi:cyclohexanone monooxygenase